MHAHFKCQWHPEYSNKSPMPKNLISGFTENELSFLSEKANIGHKHIIPLTAETDKVRFRCTKALDDDVKIREFALY